MNEEKKHCDCVRALNETDMESLIQSIPYNTLVRVRTEIYQLLKGSALSVAQGQAVLEVTKDYIRRARL